MINTVHNLDCIEGSKGIKDNSVDMVFCDLPYGETRNNWDSIVPFDLLWQTSNRVKKRNAAVCLFAKGKFLGKLMCSNINKYRYKVVCRKMQPKGHLNAKKMPMKAHEDVLVFYDRLPIYNPQNTAGHKPVNYYTKHQTDGSNYGATKTGISGGGSTERCPLDVLEFSWDTYPVHPTQKPLKLCEWFIKTYTNEGMIVLDLTAGYGSIPLAAVKLNRNFIAFDNGVCNKKGEYAGRYWAGLANERIQTFLKGGMGGE
ncbi:site-specific DNA-methyltransferase (adenine-specific) [Anaerovirgula multivorans]|uniref:Site-specific DNA-methyltransferase (Adenine-specific) n=1 Tax=Anaerovirgula multivorans TaxID=312168 RepID=A0A239CLH3_9FIRM|nr:DNA methyltransferase [Anaerovirgula multivorans]SNS21005.1 site-specific DNA-methyltransferase (adenine-specific) [Anaerovirgula multivorans]